MIITAKFAAVCPGCGNHIAVGAEIEWKKGSKAVHATCVGKTATVATKPVATARRPARRTRFTYCEGWGSDNPHAPKEGHCHMCAMMDA